MAEPTPQQRIHMDDVLRKLTAGQRVEVVDGQLNVSDAGRSTPHTRIMESLTRLIDPHVRIENLGRFGGKGLTCILRHDDQGVATARHADGFFLRQQRIPQGWQPPAPLLGAPDLAIIIPLPRESGNHVQPLVQDFVQNGGEQVWVLYPASQRLYQYRASAPDTARIYRDCDVLECDALLPNLSLPIRDLFI